MLSYPNGTASGRNKDNVLKAIEGRNLSSPQFIASKSYTIPQTNINERLLLEVRGIHTLPYFCYKIILIKIPKKQTIAPTIIFFHYRPMNKFEFLCLMLPHVYLFDSKDIIWNNPWLIAVKLNTHWRIVSNNSETIGLNPCILL